MVNSLDALRMSGVKAWWLDRLYADWTGEPVPGGAAGWHVIIAKPEMRLLAFLIIGMGVGLIFRSRDDSIIVNIIVSVIGAFAGGFGFRALVSFVGMTLYSPYASLIGPFSAQLLWCSLSELSTIYGCRQELLMVIRILNSFAVSHT